MILFFDTETTGVPKDYRAPVTDSKNWPRLVQIAWILADETGGQIETFTAIIKPDGFTIPEEAVKIHGITTAKAKEEGMPIHKALKRLWELCLVQDLIAAGHNVNFDDKIVRAEFARLKWADTLGNTRKICTMTSSTQHCKLPKPGGQAGYKWPKLQELHKKLFKSEFEGAHGAEADIQATARCFFELKRLGVIQ